MRLADRIAQCHSPYLVQGRQSGRVTRLSGAADCAEDVLHCVTRYVLCDELTRLCTALAYSRGARALACADLLHVPAASVWIEWCEAPWRSELKLYGFRSADREIPVAGRRGALIQSCPEGRRGLIRTFWAKGDAEFDVLASSMEAYFDFDTPNGSDPIAPDHQNHSDLYVLDDSLGRAEIMRRYFRFRFERTWADYYAQTSLSPVQGAAIARHALGTIAIDIPIILAFLLLLMTRPGLPRRPLMLERLNQVRTKSGKAPLLEHIEVLSPLLPEYRSSAANAALASRRPRRLHHVRGHLMRRGSQLIWRVPHLRGNAQAGVVRSRTVTWTID